MRTLHASDMAPIGTGRRRATIDAPPGGASSADLARDVRAGLLAPTKRLPCVWFYDEEGSRLFDEICETPEYYPTRTEAAILAAHAHEIVASVPRRVEVVELGSGSARKTRLLLDALLLRQPRVRYVPVDVSRTALEASAEALIADYADVDVWGVVAEYHAGLHALPDAQGAHRLFLWLGSNIGNFDRDGAAEFLSLVRSHLRPQDRLLVGVDLRKGRATLEAAYDDAAGVTAKFNLNLLARVNAELGADFDVDGFRHRATYDERLGRIEMHLVSTRAQRVTVRALGITVDFADGEAMHTENSYKYSDAEIGALAAAAGLRVEHTFTDARRWFADVLFRRLEA